MKSFYVEAHIAYRQVNRYGCDIDQDFVDGLNESIHNDYNQPDVSLTVEDVYHMWQGEFTVYDGLYIQWQTSLGEDCELLTEWVHEMVEDKIRDSYIEEDDWASGDEEYVSWDEPQINDEEDD